MRPPSCSPSRRRPRSAARATSGLRSTARARGGRLTPAELLEIADDARRHRALRGAPADVARASSSAALRDELDRRRRSSRERIGRSIDEGGEMLDSASSELAAIRKRLRTAQDRVRERLNAMLRSSADGRPHRRADRHGPRRPLRHPDPGRGEGAGEGHRPRPERVGRHALRRAADGRRAQQRLDRGDARRGAGGGADPRRAVSAPSRPVRGAPGEPRRAGARRPVARTRAARRSAWTAVRPAVADDAAELLSARHPLLGAGAVPIDLRIGERFGYRALVVTGPNTGGKTVSPRRRSGCWRSCTRPGCASRPPMGRDCRSSGG